MTSPQRKRRRRGGKYEHQLVRKAETKILESHFYGLHLESLSRILSILSLNWIVTINEIAPPPPLVARQPEN